MCGSSHTDQIAGFGSCIINGSGDKCRNEVTCLWSGYTVGLSVTYLISQPLSKYFSNCYFGQYIITSTIFHFYFSRRVIKSSFETECSNSSTILLKFFSRLHSNDCNTSIHVDHPQRFLLNLYAWISSFAVLQYEVFFLYMIQLKKTVSSYVILFQHKTSFLTNLTLFIGLFIYIQTLSLTDILFLCSSTKYLDSLWYMNIPYERYMKPKSLLQLTLLHPFHVIFNFL